MARKSGSARIVTRSEIADKLRGRGISAPRLVALIDAFFDIVAQELEDPMAEIRLPGFATIKTVTRAARTMHNIKTKEKMEVGPVRCLKVSPAVALRNRLNGRD